MRIKNISLVNFKKFRNANFKFKPGINVIHGNNGSGKTTILQAITYAIYGGNISELRYHQLNTFGTEHMQVQLLIEENNKETSIVRKLDISNGMAKQTILLDNETRSQKYVEEYFSKIFGSKEWYDDFISIDQDNIGDFVEITDISYLKKYLKHLCYTKFDLIKEKIGILLNQMRKNANSIQNYELELKFIEEEIEQTKNNIRKINEKSSKYKNEINELRQKIEFMESELSEINTDKITYDYINSNNMNTNRNLMSIEKNIVEIFEKTSKIKLKENELKESILFKIQNIKKDLALFYDTLLSEIKKYEDNKLRITKSYQISKGNLESIIYESYKNESKLELFENELNEYNIRKSNLIENLVMLDDYLNKINFLTFSKDVINSVEFKIINYKVEELIKIANYMLKKLNTRYNKIVLEDSRINIQMDSLNMSFDVLSAADRSILNLIIRFALIKMSDKKTFLLFDDPYSFLDRVNRTKIKNLYEIMLKSNDQIIITSHFETNKKYNIIKLENNI
jgi:exonuclease SbcC